MRDLEEIPSGTSVEVGCIHAEMNAIINCARETVSSQSKVLFVNGEPCRMCSKLMINSGVTHVFYRTAYRDPSGVELLASTNVTPVHYDQWKDAWR